MSSFTVWSYRPLIYVHRILADCFSLVPTVVQPGETLYYERRSGGKGANQAAAVAKAGGSVTLVGAVGSDGDWVLKNLKAIGVDVAYVIVSPDVSDQI